MTPTEKAARWYCTEGYSVIPIRADASKKPLVKWEQYQKEKPLLQQIEEWWGKWPDANIGLVTGEISGISVVDKDLHKMTPEQKAETAKLLPPENTPTANSISGGEHVYYQYHADIPQTAGLIPHVDTRNNGGYIIAPPSAINGRKYLWQTGKAINKIPLAIIQKHTLSLLLSSTSIPSISRGDVTGAISPDITNITKYNKIQEGSRDQQLFHLANHLVKSKMPTEEVLYYLSLMANNCCDPPFPEKELLGKLQSAVKRASDRSRNLADEVREWVFITSGNFFITNLLHDITTYNKEEKQAVRQQIHRMCKEGLIEKHGDKRGCYRTPEREITFEDFKNVDSTTVDLRLPFGFERYVEIMPGDIISFAGVRNSGKTAIALECVRLNMRRLPVFYFSKEIRKYALNRRLSKHNDLDVSDWNFKFCSNFPNFTDILQPDAVNVIDYLEVSEGEYYKMASILAKIHANLKGQAIAIVFLQKHTGARHAMGGEGTEQKPAITFNIDPGFPGAILTAHKIKNWVDINPEGYGMKFKIVQGINLLPQGLWEPT